MAYTSGVLGDATLGSMPIVVSSWTINDSSETSAIGTSAGGGWTERGAGVGDSTITINAYLDSTDFEADEIVSGTSLAFVGTSTTGVTVTGNYMTDDITIEVDWDTNKPVTVTISAGQV